jgi:hypothetical protein
MREKEEKNKEKPSKIEKTRENTGKNCEFSRKTFTSGFLYDIIL